MISFVSGDGIGNHGNGMSSDKYSLDKLSDIVARLRGEGGCPWDRKQTHESIKPHIVEEAYEVVDAIDSHDTQALIEELGDVLLHVVFHSQLGSEEGAFNLGDVIHAIQDKMIRRHPHVFGDATVKSTDEVLRNWERIKQDEASQETGILAKVPRSLPALMRAHKVQEMAARVGFDWAQAKDAFEKVVEETNELREAMDSKNREGISEELGDLLFAIVNVARHLGVQPELSLMDTVDKFIKRFSFIEAQAKDMGMHVEDMTLKQMDSLWDKAKESEDL